MEGPRDEEIRSALVSQLGNIFDLDDVKRFLVETDLYKSAGARAVCWLIAMQVVRPARTYWVSNLREIYQQYERLLNGHFDGKSSPLDLFPADSAPVVKADTMRTKPWFIRLCSQIGIEKEAVNDCEERAQRILATIILVSPKCGYTQGQDRFVWVSLLVSLSFAITGGLSSDFAEAMAFSLGKGFISKIKISRNLGNLAALERIFSKLDQIVKQEVPEISKMLEQCGTSSIQYALKWQLTLFADEHNIYELMFLWDQILAREDDMTNFVICLCVAHIKQVPIPHEADEMAVTIQRCRSWDITKIVDDANELMKRTERRESCCDWLSNCIINWFETLSGYRRL